jgi:putative flippase GtrA
MASWRLARTAVSYSSNRFTLFFLAIVCNDLILWFMGKILHPAHLNVTLWENISKPAAIGGTILITYLGMRLWVFVQSSHQKRERFVHTDKWRHEELPDKTASDHALHVKYT